MTFPKHLTFRRAPTPVDVEDFEAVSHEFFETAYCRDVGPTGVMVMRLVDRELDSLPLFDDLHLTTYDLQARLLASEGDLERAFERLLRAGLMQLDTNDGAAVLLVPSHVKRTLPPAATRHRQVRR